MDPSATGFALVIFVLLLLVNAFFVAAEYAYVRVRGTQLQERIEAGSARARKAMRIEQEEKLRVELAPGDAATLRAALERALAHPDAGLREGDVSAPENPRRMQLVLEKLGPVLKLAVKAESD